MSQRPEDGAGAWDDEAPWTEDDEWRAHAARELAGRRRRRRQAVVFTVLVLLVLGAGTGAAVIYQGWWQWPFGGEEPQAARTVTVCPTPEPVLAPADVTLSVLNSTDRPGLAAGVAAELQARGFVVAAVGNDPVPGPRPGSAVVRHGPDGQPAARVVAAQIQGAELGPDSRAGTAVELSLGEGYTALLPPEAAQALLVPAPLESPAGCVAP